MFIDPTPFGPTELNEQQTLDANGGIIFTAGIIVGAAIIAAAVALVDDFME